MSTGLKVTLGILGALVLVILLGISSVVGTYNGLVSLNQQADQAWSQVENQLQRRFDLIPNLVETVKGYAAHESGVMDAIAQARTHYSGAATPADKMAAEGELTSALSRLMVITENYPNLKADAQFLRLQDELAGTENRIATERMRYNQVIKNYNTSIKVFPTVFFARMLGFADRPYFEADKAAQQAPKVSFK